MSINPAQWVRTCPYCSATPTPFQERAGFDTTGPQGHNRRWYAASCLACGGVAVFEGDGTGNLIAMHPETTGDWTVMHVPSAVAQIWDEAVRVYKVGAYASAVVACGRALEAAADERAVKGKTLQQRIETMRSEGLITTEFRDAMDYVRLIRNVGAHAGQEVSPESAEGTMRFTQQMLRLLFEVPGELGHLTGRPPELNGPDS